MLGRTPRNRAHPDLARAAGAAATSHVRHHQCTPDVRRSDVPGVGAGRDESGAIFLARTDALGPSGWVSIEVTVGATGWQPRNMGQCDPHVVLSAEFESASWALDPAFPSPTPGTTDLHILVWERACSGGSPTTGRMSAAVTDYSVEAVTITIGVRPLQAAPGTAFGCPMPPGTPALVRLREPLGNRTLLDGGHVPPAPPSPANG